MLVVMTTRMGSNPISAKPPHLTRDYDSKDKELEISCHCLDKERNRVEANGKSGFLGFLDFPKLNLKK